MTIKFNKTLRELAAPLFFFSALRFSHNIDPQGKDYVLPPPLRGGSPLLAPPAPAFEKMACQEPSAVSKVFDSPPTPV
jgi:hypothetical protein